MRTPSGFTVLLLACGVATAAAQAVPEDETLIKGKTESGGFGGPVVVFTPVRGEFGVFVGGRGGWIINHTLIIGGGGYGLVTEHPQPLNTPGGTAATRLDAGYGGFEIEYVHSSRRLVHWSVRLLLGGGSANWAGDGMMGEGDGFFVAEPAVNVTLNISRHVRLSAGGGYRFVSGVNLPGLDDGDLAGPAAILTARFGKF